MVQIKLHQALEYETMLNIVQSITKNKKEFIIANIIQDKSTITNLKKKSKN